MNVPIHHLVRQLRDTGWGWREIAVAFPELGLDPAVDYDAVAAGALRDVVRAAGPAGDSPGRGVTLCRTRRHLVPRPLSRSVAGR